jgi:hypothetical protein
MSRAWNSDAQLDGDTPRGCPECDGLTYIHNGIRECRDCEWSRPTGVGHSDAGPGARGGR